MSIPLSLYLHIPWCVEKCPYCDFNSHTFKAKIPEREYVARALRDLRDDIARFDIDRPLASIFIGGGTPSLFSGSALRELLDGVREQIILCDDVEITLEANPGTVDEKHFRDYFRAGVNRLSVGIQSFNSHQLEKLGRIHNPADAERAVKTAQDIGFDNINIDLMFGLPEQTEEQAHFDVENGISLCTEHLSYYQLTLEPNTAFAKNPPKLPEEEYIDTRFDSASDLLINAGFKRYEVSAWSRGRQSTHNRNYWEHGDYLGIGAGAHGKITINNSSNNISSIINNKININNNSSNNLSMHSKINNKESIEKPYIIRTTKPRSPKHYLNQSTNLLTISPEFRTERIIGDSDKAFEFMLNAMRLTDGFSRYLIAERGLFDEDSIMPILTDFVNKGLLVIDETHIRPTELGYRFVNEIVGGFL